MANNYIDIPVSGNPSWKDPVANAAALPLIGNNIGDARVTEDTSLIWVWNGSAWVFSPGSGGTVTSVGLADASSSPLYAISGSPVTSSGTLTLTLNTAAANKVLAGPTTGSPAQPTMRSLVAADIPALSYVTSVGLADSTNLFNISGSPVTSSGTLTLSSYKSQNANTFLAAPNGSSGAPTFRIIASADLPNLSGTYVPQSEVGVANGVASLDSSGKVPVGQLPSVVMEYQGAWNPSTNTPTLSDGTGTNGNVYYVTALFAGPISGLTDPSMVNFQIGDLVIYTDAVGKWQLVTPAAGVQSVNGAQGAVTVNAINQLTGDVTAGPASGSQSAASSIASTVVTSKVLTGYAVGANTAILSTDTILAAFGKVQGQISATSGSAITSLTGDGTAAGPGAAAFTLATVNSNVGSFGSSTAIPSFTVNAKGLVTAASTNVVIAPAGTLTGTTLASNVIASSLTSVGTISSGTWNGTAIAVANGGTSTNTLTLNNVILGNGTSAPLFVAPSTSGNVLTSNGTTWVSSAPATSGTVTSVALSDASTSPIYSVSGSPVTSSGTLTLTLGTQAANKVFAGPTTGSAAQPTFRSLVVADIPSLPYASSTLTSAHIFVGNVSNVATDVAVSGDLALANTGAFTFNTVNSNVGSFGSSTSIPTFTVNGKGLITAASGNAVIAPAGTLTGTTLASNVVTSSLTSVGTIATGIWNGTTIAVANGGTGLATLTANNVILGAGTSTPTFVAPSTSGNVLTSNGTTWVSSPATGGGVTSVAMTVPTFLSISGSPITTSGTLAVSLSGTALPVANGGTGTTTAFTAGSVIYAGASGTYSQDNANYFWDATNHRLGLGTASPSTILSIGGGTDQTIATERNTSGGGSTLKIRTGGAQSGSTNQNGGDLELYSGIPTGSGTSYINFFTAGGGGSGTSDGTLVKNMVLGPTGSLGLGSSFPGSYSLEFSGQAAKSIGMIRETTAATAGNSLTISSGGAVSGGTNLNGGDLVLQSGTATGTGSSKITFQTVAAGATGTTDRTPTTAMTILGSGNVGVGNTSPGTAFTTTAFATSSVTYLGGVSTYTILATDFAIVNSSVTCTITLPTASTCAGRILVFTNQTAHQVLSGSSNVVPLGSTGPGTGITAGQAGKFSVLQSDGTNWVTLFGA